jgi:hypothetical protein
MDYLADFPDGIKYEQSEYFMRWKGRRRKTFIKKQE